ncbi:MAG: hypothetical protein UY96_C0010G0035 [Parcubacteria group bacterium GW2011_GWB1_56_8]|nr:MAG: hypothetical protein UY96_C0010G0035 [Parcubacteria group bacterium GW2011_GWB1_56_8]
MIRKKPRSKAGKRKFRIDSALAPEVFTPRKLAEKRNRDAKCKRAKRLGKASKPITPEREVKRLVALAIEWITPHNTSPLISGVGFGGSFDSTRRD